MYQGPRSFYIDETGMAYLFDPVLPGVNVTTAWIDDNTYKTSPLSFKVPAIPNQYFTKWHMLKREVRLWYIKNLRDKIEPYYRKVGLTWCVDMEPLDFRTAKPQLRTNRQIILIAGLISWILEYVWDFVVAAIWPEKAAEKKKPKSLMSNKRKEESKSEGKEEVKKAPREKLD